MRQHPQHYIGPYEIHASCLKSHSLIQSLVTTLKAANAKKEKNKKQNVRIKII